MYYVYSKDGKKYGPADLNTVRSWYADGFVLPYATIEDAQTKQQTLLWNHSIFLQPPVAGEPVAPFVLAKEEGAVAVAPPVAAGTPPPTAAEIARDIRAAEAPDKRRGKGSAVPSTIDEDDFMNTPPQIVPPKAAAPEDEVPAPVAKSEQVEVLAAEATTTPASPLVIEDLTPVGEPRGVEPISAEVASAVDDILAYERPKAQNVAENDLPVDEKVITVEPVTSAESAAGEPVVPETEELSSPVDALKTPPALLWESDSTAEVTHELKKNA